MRALATAGVLLSQVAPAQAQSPAWDAFHEALDSFEYEKAARLAEKVAEGSQRDLARAELAVLSGLPHRSYTFTDRISISEIPVESLAVYYLVKIHQESKTPRPTSVEKRQVIMRLLKEGLRQEGPARNLARLLIYQIQHASGDLDTTRQIVEKLAKLPNVEPRLVVDAQAMLASRERKFEQAASLWAVLAQSSTLRGDATAALIYRARSLRQHLEQTGDLAPEAIVLTKRLPNDLALPRSQLRQLAGHHQRRSSPGARGKVKTSTRTGPWAPGLRTQLHQGPAKPQPVGGQNVGWMVHGDVSLRRSQRCRANQHRPKLAPPVLLGRLPARHRPVTRLGNILRMMCGDYIL